MISMDDFRCPVDDMFYDPSLMSEFMTGVDPAELFGTVFVRKPSFEAFSTVSQGNLSAGS